MSTKNVKINEKISRQANRVLLIGIDKDGDEKRVLKYDITPYSYLFEGCLMTKPIKADLIKEIEKKCNKLTSRLLS